VRILADIVEACKTNQPVDNEELKYALLVYVSMFNIEHAQFQKELSGKGTIECLRQIRLESSFKMYHTALNKSPKEYLGWDNDPANPAYQKFHAAGSKLIDKIIKKAEEKK
jgi:hypothetical protein